MNKHSADATTAEEALAIQETLDSNMATEVAMKNTLLTPRFYTTDFDELDAVDVSHIRSEWDPLIDRAASAAMAIRPWWRTALGCITSLKSWLALKASNANGPCFWPLSW